MQKWNQVDFSFGNAQRKCVQININGDFDHGKKFYMEADWSIFEFLNAASKRLEMVPAATKLFSSDGVEINDCMMIEDNDILFLSFNDAFIPPIELDSGSGSDQQQHTGGAGDQVDKIPSSIGGYKVGNLLGKGGFGEVRVGEHQLTEERVALKFLRKSEIQSLGAATRTNREIQCLAALKHMNIIRLQQHLDSLHHVVFVFELMEGGDLLQYLLKKEQQPQTQTSSLLDNSYTDYGGNGNDGSLVDEGNDSMHSNHGSSSSSSSSSSNSRLKRSPVLSEDEAKHVLYQVLSAVSYAHNQHICHRDLKLENILLKDHTLAIVKIADFGLSDFYRPGTTMKSNCGTLSFLAPEVFKGNAMLMRPLDVWSLGVILFAVLCGRLPFEGPDLKGTRRPREAVIRSRITKCQYRLDESLTVEAKDLLRRMLQPDPQERITIPEIFSHVWMRSGANSPFLETLQNSSQQLQQQQQQQQQQGMSGIKASNQQHSRGPTPSSLGDQQQPQPQPPQQPHSSMNNNNAAKIEVISPLNSGPSHFPPIHQTLDPILQMQQQSVPARKLQQMAIDEDYETDFPSPSIMSMPQVPSALSGETPSDDSSSFKLLSPRPPPQREVSGISFRSNSTHSLDELANEGAVDSLSSLENAAALGLENAAAFGHHVHHSSGHFTSSYSSHGNSSNNSSVRNRANSSQRANSDMHVPPMLKKAAASATWGESCNSISTVQTGIESYSSTVVSAGKGSDNLYQLDEQLFSQQQAGGGGSQAHSRSHSLTGAELTNEINDFAKAMLHADDDEHDNKNSINNNNNRSSGVHELYQNLRSNAVGDKNSLGGGAPSSSSSSGSSSSTSTSSIAAASNSTAEGNAPVVTTFSKLVPLRRTGTQPRGGGDDSPEGTPRARASLQLTAAAAGIGSSALGAPGGSLSLPNSPMASAGSKHMARKGGRHSTGGNAAYLSGGGGVGGAHGGDEDDDCASQRGSAANYSRGLVRRAANIATSPGGTPNYSSGTTPSSRSRNFHGGGGAGGGGAAATGIAHYASPIGSNRKGESLSAASHSPPPSASSNTAGVNTGNSSSGGSTASPNIGYHHSPISASKHVHHDRQMHINNAKLLLSHGSNNPNST